MNIKLTAEELSIYNFLEDEKSKEIFKTWAYCAQRGISKGVYDNSIEPLFITQFEKPQQYAYILSKLRHSKFFIYGGGHFGERIVSILKNEDCLDNCLGIWDKKLFGKDVYGLTVTAPPERRAEGECVVIAVSEIFKPKVFNEIVEYLRGIGFSYEQIIKPYYSFILNVDTYFDKDIILPFLGKNEVFIDAGSYNLFNALRFYELCKKQGADVKKIYSFEPNQKQYELCVKKGIEIGCVEVIKAGLWSCDTKLSFIDETNRMGGSRVISESENKVQVVALDDTLPKDECVTFIKMDIEGAELEALKGAKQIIKRDRPKLAICIYHKANDYIEIPTYLRSIVPDYKMWLRTYKTTGGDTVLYCV